jgi:glutamyl-tRNA reductase
MSAATAAVSVIEERLGALAHRSVLVIGAGQAGRQALARLAKRRTGRLVMASRSERHAREAAERTGARAVALDALPTALAQADAVLAATVSPGYLVRPDSFEGAPPRDRLLVDLSVPRVIAPAVAGLAGVTLRTVDDLGDVVRASALRRAREIPGVEAIAREEAHRAWLQFEARAERLRQTDPGARPVLRAAAGLYPAARPDRFRAKS